MASSPAAAAFALRNHAQVAGAETPEEADQIGRHTVLDLTDSDATEGIDVGPGSYIEEDEIQDASGERRLRRLLQDMARDADALKGAKDAKLQKAITLIAELVRDSYQPIVFCRFIATAEYVAQELRKRLPKVEIAAVTDQLPPAEREERVQQLAKTKQRVLVCTDCLSEGINLQEHFNAVLHYDLSWNPTRHEQREGRVDHFGQARPRVRVMTYYGQNNIIDGIVLDVLINKHRKIRNTLGISVPVPIDTEQVVEAIFESVLAHVHPAQGQPSQQQLPGFADPLHEKREELFKLWDASSAREENSRRTIFAQQSLKIDDVKKELYVVRGAIGLFNEVADFTKDALEGYGAFVSETANKEVIQFNLKDIPTALADAIDLYRWIPKKEQPFTVSFTQPSLPDTLYLSRTHPLVEGLAAYVMDTALDKFEDPHNKPVARRCGVIRTKKVKTRTTLLLVRLRFHITAPQRAGKEVQPLLAEDCRVFAFHGEPTHAEWLDDENQITELLRAESEANISQALMKLSLQPVINNLREHIIPQLEQRAYMQADELSDAHRRVRRATSFGIKNLSVKPQLPPDILGIYIYLPSLGS
jgi:hypothetical protein